MVLKICTSESEAEAEAKGQGKDSEVSIVISRSLEIFATVRRRDGDGALRLLCHSRKRRGYSTVLQSQWLTQRQSARCNFLILISCGEKHFHSKLVFSVSKPGLPRAANDLGRMSPQPAVSVRVAVPQQQLQTKNL